MKQLSKRPHLSSYKVKVILTCILSNTMIKIIGLGNIYTASAFVSKHLKPSFHHSHKLPIFQYSKGKSYNTPPDKRNNNNKTKYVNNINTKKSLSSSSKKVKLQEPSIVFSNNHLLFVNKPPGYHCQPNESIEQRQQMSNQETKCLLTKLQNRELGGGSSNNFLLPMHRLDQPCTGIVLLAKTSKAGTRVGNAFRKHQVKKDYFCVVEGNLKNMIQRSSLVTVSQSKDVDNYHENSITGGNIYEISGILQKKTGSFNKNSKSGESVSFVRLPSDTEQMSLNDKERICQIRWELLHSISGGSYHDLMSNMQVEKKDLHLVRVTTSTGAKHQVRAMLSQLAKSPICGDLRYGAARALPDMSVALHARSLYLPTVSIGDTDMKTQVFVAPIPLSWKEYFSLRESNLRFKK